MTASIPIVRMPVASGIGRSLIGGVPAPYSCSVNRVCRSRPTTWWWAREPRRWRSSTRSWPPPTPRSSSWTGVIVPAAIGSTRIRLCGCTSPRRTTGSTPSRWGMTASTRPPKRRVLRACDPRRDLRLLLAGAPRLRGVRPRPVPGHDRLPGCRRGGTPPHLAADGQNMTVKVRRRLVDATYVESSIPSRPRWTRSPGCWMRVSSPTRSNGSSRAIRGSSTGR